MAQKLGCPTHPWRTTRWMVSLRESLEMRPWGSQPARTWNGVWLIGADRARRPIRSEPGPSMGSPRWRRNTAPADRLASLARRPSGPARPSKVSPAEWATMNHGGTPAATSDPIIDPAEVPTMYSALPGSQRVALAMAYMPPVSQAPPRTPPAPSTRPTRLGLADLRSDAEVPITNSYPRRRFLHLVPFALRSASHEVPPLGSRHAGFRQGGVTPFFSSGR